jgi:hypothetical protein
LCQGKMRGPQKTLNPVCRHLSSRETISCVILPFARSIFNTLCRNICSSAFVSMAGETETVIFFSGFYSQYYFLILFLALGVCYYLFNMADALYQAIKLKVTSLRKYNRWYFYSAIVLCHFLLIAFSIYNNFIPIKVYRIPTSSMAPTLLPGDYFLIDKNYYEKHAPQRGEIIVFQSPGDSSKDFIKRAIGDVHKFIS